MIERSEWYDKLRSSFDKDPEYWVEEMRFAFSDEVGRMMNDRGVTRAELARRLNTSPAYITRLFRALFNPTLLTLAKVAVALDAKVSLHLSPAEAEATHWFDVVQSARPTQVAVEPCWRTECGAPVAPEAVVTGRNNERATAAAAA